jgi:hypothetical protein
MNAKKLTVVFFVLISAIVAQQKENYFPHSVGNAWQYAYNDGRIFKEVIVRDSILADSSLFLLILNPLLKKINQTNWDYWISKNQDSVKRGRTLLYIFPMNPGDKWMRWDSISQFGIMGHCSREFEINIFGVQTKGHQIDYFSKYEIQDTSTEFYDWAWTEQIADGFGKIWWGNEVEYYQLIGCIIDSLKYGTIMDVEHNISNNNPDEYSLFQNYPNPFNANTQISFYLKNSGYSQLLVYNPLGEIVKVLIKEFILAGFHTVKFDASNYPSGIYFYSFIFKNRSISKKMIYLK